MAEPVTDAWHPWVVAPGSGFEVFGPDGRLALVQVGPERFLATRRFRFDQPRVVDDLVRRLERSGRTSADAVRAVDDARHFEPVAENPTDLASIPRFMRWFESSYGLHTLAAILHDELIQGAPNAGALGSDVLADRFFRQMVQAAGTPWLKRWIMWSAVALRTRWAAGGWRRGSVLAWVVSAMAGMALFVTGVRDTVGRRPDPQAGRRKLAAAVAMPFAAGFLWGKQYPASVIAAVAAIWVLPAAVFALIGSGVYWLLERGARAVRLR